MGQNELAELFENRDERAIAAAKSEYGAYLMTVAVNILTDSRDAEECVSDALLAAWNSIPPERPENLRAYLGRVTRNLALNRLKSRLRQKRGGGQAEEALEELYDVAGTLGDPERAVDDLELTRALELFLAGLKPEKRRVFMARYWYMYPIRDIARAEGCGESRIKSRLSRLREELRQFLEKEGYAL